MWIWSITKEAYDEVLKRYQVKEVTHDIYSNTYSARTVETTTQVLEENDLVGEVSEVTITDYGVGYHAMITRAARNRLIKSKWNTPWDKNDIVKFSKF